MFADRGGAVVAGTACTNDLYVVNSKSGCPNVGVVTILANFCCQNVRGVLTGRFDTVMTAGAVTGNPNVVEVRWQPAGCRMTVVALIAAGNVGRVLSSCCNTVMTRAAGAKYLSVVNGEDWLKTDSAVAVFANVRCRDVDRASSSRRYAVVTGNAVADNANMVEQSRQPTGNGVAVVALVARRNVSQCLACRGDAIVTTVTTASQG